MSDINNPERLKVPLKDKTGYFYPITSYNQIVMPDGTFWDGETLDINAVYVDRTGSVVGPAALTNADALGGIAANQYMLKSDIDIQEEINNAMPNIKDMLKDDIQEEINNALAKIQNASGVSF